MTRDKYTEHADKKMTAEEVLDITSMDLDCSGAGMCQPEPVEAEISDIQPAYPRHKLDKAEAKAADDVKQAEMQKAVEAFEKEKNIGR